MIVKKISDSNFLYGTLHMVHPNITLMLQKCYRSCFTYLRYYNGHFGVSACDEKRVWKQKNISLAKIERSRNYLTCNFKL